MKRKQQFYALGNKLETYQTKEYVEDKEKKTLKNKRKPCKSPEIIRKNIVARLKPFIRDSFEQTHENSQLSITIEK